MYRLVGYGQGRQKAILNSSQVPELRSDGAGHYILPSLLLPKSTQIVSQEFPPTNLSSCAAHALWGR